MTQVQVHSQLAASGLSLAQDHICLSVLTLMFSSTDQGEWCASVFLLYFSALGHRVLTRN